MEEKSLGQIAYEEWAMIVHPSGAIPWERVGMQVGWENVAQACVIEVQRQHQLEMGYYPSMLEKSEEECCELSDAPKKARELLSQAKPFCVGKEGDSQYCDEAHAIRRAIVEFLIKAPVV